MVRHSLATAVAGFVAALSLAACGSSQQHPAKTANPTGPGTPVTSSTSVNPGGPDISASSSTSVNPGGPDVPASSSSTATTSTTTASHPAPRGGAHLDARFGIVTDGTVMPTQVMLPSGVTVVLQVINDDTRAHTVTLDVLTHPGAHLAPGAHVSKPVGRLPNGSYRLLVDGRTAAHLVIGVAPGP